MRIIATAFLLFTFYFLLIPHVFASLGDASRLDPSNSLYFLKSVKELIEIKLAGTEKVRILRRLEFAQRRLREANSLVSVKREDLIASNMEKFLHEVSEIGFIPDVSLHETISANLGNYMENLTALYANIQDPSAKRSVRSIIYRFMDFNAQLYKDKNVSVKAKILAPQISKFNMGCTLLARESASSAINEAEKEILSERGEKCKELLIWQ